MLKEIIIIICGYAFSIFAGHLLIKNFAKKAYTKIGTRFTYIWTASLVGMVERALYTSSILFFRPEFIAVWIAFKIASQWKRWQGKTDQARAIFNIYLINTGLSIAYGVIGGMVSLWFIEDMYLYGFVAIGCILLFNLIIIGMALPNKNKKK